LWRLSLALAAGLLLALRLHLIELRLLLGAHMDRVRHRSS
jgi:hypothetical protein